jgi:DNA-binding LacI/PurR family transcriptional regulator
MCAPPLTSVAMPMEAGGRAAVDLLLARIGAAGQPDGGPCRELSTNLIVRATTATATTSSPAASIAPATPGKGRLLNA